MTPQEALKCAIDFFGQKSMRSKDYWEYGDLTREEIAEGLRQLSLPPEGGEKTGKLVGYMNESGGLISKAEYEGDM